MSYILDALRKSDQLRQQHAAPTLLLGQATAAPSKQPAPLLYAGLAFILLAAGIAIGWLRPWQAEPVAATPLPAQHAKLGSVVAHKPQPNAASAGAQAIPSPAPREPVLAAPATATKVAPVQASAPAPKQSVARATPQPAAPALSARAETPPPVRSDREAKSSAAAPSMMAMADLPLVIQQELPPMTISVHAYSSRPAERLVGINDKLLHEGDEVAPGLKLLEITPKGMVLSFKGYTFRRGVH